MDPINVLIVEDDPMVAGINQDYTTAVPGYRVVGIAKTGSDALQKINSLAPDLLILDIFLPEINGIEILSLLRREEKPLDVIMITAADDAETIQRIMRQGVFAYITKPFKFSRFQATLESYKRYRQTLLQKDTLAQSDIDSIMSGPIGETEERTPKNFHIKTLTLVTDFLRNSEKPLSAEEVASGVGISRVTSRRYLEYLVSSGKVEMDLCYIAVGRPVHRFRLLR